MSAPEIIEFSYMEEGTEHPLRPGHWTWRVIKNARTPVCKCLVCGSEYMISPQYTIAQSDGLIGSPGGRGFTCRRAPACPIRGRFLLRDFKAHRKMVD